MNDQLWSRWARQRGPGRGGGREGPRLKTEGTQGSAAAAVESSPSPDMPTSQPQRNNVSVPAELIFSFDKNISHLRGEALAYDRKSNFGWVELGPVTWLKHCLP